MYNNYFVLTLLLALFPRGLSPLERYLRSRNVTGRCTGRCNAEHEHELFNVRVVVLGGVMVSVHVIGSKDRGFKPSRGRRTSKGDKNTYYDFLRRGSNVVGPMY
jgi:hypothetical protein